IREGDKVIELPAIQAAVRSLAIAAMKGSRLSQRALAELVRTVEDRKASEHLTVLENAFEYKQTWTAELERRSKYGIDEPAPIPHPDDVIIDMRTGRVRTDGPLDEIEKKAWDERLARRVHPRRSGGFRPQQRVLRLRRRQRARRPIGAARLVRLPRGNQRAERGQPGDLRRVQHSAVAAAQLHALRLGRPQRRRARFRRRRDDHRQGVLAAGLEGGGAKDENGPPMPLPSSAVIPKGPPNRAALLCVGSFPSLSRR